MSTVIHEAARIRLGVQKCRRCGYVLHDWNRETTVGLRPQRDVKWAAGQLVVTRLNPPYRSSWRSQNCPQDVLAEAVFCDAHNTGTKPDK